MKLSLIGRNLVANSFGQSRENDISTWI